MKVVFIYRRSLPGAFSIENLFRSIAASLWDYDLHVVHYEMGPRIRILSDICALWKLNADIYHVTGDVNYVALLLPKDKTVLTIHDIGHYLFVLKGLRRWFYKWLWFVLPARRVAALTSVSEVTRQHLIRYIGVAERHISIIHNCYAPTFRPAHRLFNDHCPRILQVGTISYKNVPRLIEALDGLHCHLVLVGALDGATLYALNRADVSYENLIDLSHEELVNQYRQADLVAFVSVGEGFGLPIIEAQAMGKPLITSNLEPMSIVAGDGACLVDPLSVPSIRTGIKKLLQDEWYRHEVVKKGLQNARLYSPPVISALYYSLYRRVIKNAKSA